MTLILSETHLRALAVLFLAVLCLLASDFRIVAASKSWGTTTVPTTKSLTENCNSTSSTIHHDAIAADSNNNNNKRYNQTYSWYGNHWMPPPGVPLYTKEDMKAAFSQFDTLWIGDSTTRRAYATMFALINATKSVVSVKELDDGRVIDINKRAIKGIIDEDTCQRQRGYAKQYNQPDMVNLWTGSSVCRQIDGERAFDYVRADCYKEISQIPHLYWEMQRYSLVILGVGVHNLLSPYLCRSHPTLSPLGSSPAEKQQQESRPTSRFVPVNQVLVTHGLEGARDIATSLHRAHKNETRPTAVLWRTSGFDTKTSHVTMDILLQLNQLSVDFIRNNTRSTDSSDGTLGLVDWGAAIWPRSLPPDRIEGDIGAHYGLEARLLMAQMTTQELMSILERHQRLI